MSNDQMPDRLTIAGCALEAGIALSTAYGQGGNKLCPISDYDTLEKFARLMLKSDLAGFAGTWRPIENMPLGIYNIAAVFGNLGCEDVCLCFPYIDELDDTIQYDSYTLSKPPTHWLNVDLGHNQSLQSD